jgi:serine/threonine kinase 16
MAMTVSKLLIFLQAHMTATFRPPEWFDVPSPAQLDAGAADVWAAGCTLYALMYGQSPFQLAINQVCGLRQVA